MNKMTPELAVSLSPFKCHLCGWEGEKRDDKICPNCIRIRVYRYRDKHPEEYRQQKKKSASKYDKRQRENNREEYNAKRRRNRKHETLRLNLQQRLAWLSEGDVTRQDLIDVYTRDRVCVYCGEAVTPRFTPSDPRGFDHIVPRIKGGRHTKINLVLSCRKCNELKSDKEVQ